MFVNTILKVDFGTDSPFSYSISRQHPHHKNSRVFSFVLQGYGN